MTELEILVNKYTKEQLAEQLLFYKDLDRKGNVYYEYPPEDHFSVRQLIKMVCPGKETDILLNCSFTKNDKNQKRDIGKYNTHKNILNLANKLSRYYVKDYKTSAPRTKGYKETNELLDCKSSICNWYPSSYIKYVREYINSNPIKEWYKGSKDELEDKFNTTTVDNVVKYICITCNKHLLKDSRRRHLITCKD